MHHHWTTHPRPALLPTSCSMTGNLLGCERCGKPHERCAGHSKRSGGPCGMWPLRGQRVCKIHGGGSPQALAAAETRMAEAAAQAVVEKQLWSGVDKAVAVSDPVQALSLLAGALLDMVNSDSDLTRRINELKTLEAGDSLSQVRGVLLLWDKVVGHSRGLLTDLARLGLAERGVRLEEGRAGLVVSAVQVGLDAVELSPDQRRVFTEAFLGVLRPGLAAGVVLPDVGGEG